MTRSSFLVSDIVPILIVVLHLFITILIPVIFIAEVVFSFNRLKIVIVFEISYLLHLNIEPSPGEILNEVLQPISGQSDKQERRPYLFHDRGAVDVDIDGLGVEDL